MTADPHLIITADDFGMARSVNEGVVDAIENGCVTATSLLPNGPAFDHAVGLARDHEIDVGVHLGLVQENPVASPASVPSLLGEDERLLDGYGSFLRAYVTGRINSAELRRELSAQVNKVAESGLPITHIDSHQHLHMIPGVLTTVMDLADEHDIPSVRVADEQLIGLSSMTVPILGLKTLSKWAKRRLSNRALVYNETFRGVVQQEAPTAGEMRKFLGRLTRGVAEFGCHLAMEAIEDSTRIKKQRDFRGTYDWAIAEDTLDMMEQSRVDLVGWDDITDTDGVSK